jgi:signal transduction histidine kinase
MRPVPQRDWSTLLDADHEVARLEKQNRSMRKLTAVIQELSLARDLPAIISLVRSAARQLTGADGATFVLREGDQCHYADEDAIGPLWKGQRFPLSACISGWVMLHGRPAIIEDIYADPRVPADAYRPTFVKSLVMVPIRSASPVGAIGNYWAQQRKATDFELELLQALANTTAVAMENIQVYASLEERVRERTLQIEDTNLELEAYASSVSHDLRGPLHAIDGFVSLLEFKLESCRDPDVLDFLSQIHLGVRRMTEVTADLLRLARIAREGLRTERVNLTTMAEDLMARFRATDPERAVAISIQDGMTTIGDSGLLRIAMENLLSNAWKYTSKRTRTVIDFGSAASLDGWSEFQLRDNGAGFDPRQSEKLFIPFQRLHRQDEFTGTGVGLATVQRIIHRHGGRIWAEGEPNRGATFHFTLPGPSAAGSMAN